ncbi:MAG: hypothetical protein SW127_10820, partial [Actinomycetota bacterium]|nr:hypothetical protein [Actinomycetota bacterium]
RARKVRADADALAARSAEEAEEAAQLIAERTAAMEAEHKETMSAAHDEARRIVTKAKGEAAELELQSTRARQSERERHDAELAAQRERARHEAQRMKDTAQEIATERLARSRELAAQADRARKQVVEQLGRVRDEVAKLPVQLSERHQDLAELTENDDVELLNRALSSQSQIKRSGSNGTNTASSSSAVGSSSPGATR